MILSSEDNTPLTQNQVLEYTSWFFILWSTKRIDQHKYIYMNKTKQIHILTDKKKCEGSDPVIPSYSLRATKIKQKVWTHKHHQPQQSNNLVPFTEHQTNTFLKWCFDLITRVKHSTFHSSKHQHCKPQMQRSKREANGKRNTYLIQEGGHRERQ